MGNDVERILAKLEEALKRTEGKVEVVALFDDSGDVCGGISMKEEEFEVLVECGELPQMKKIFEGVAPTALVKVSSSPGHWCLCGRRLCWCP